MASGFKISTTLEGLTSLDALATPLPDPQPDFQKYRVLLPLGNLSQKGMGPQTAIWIFPLLETEQVSQLETFQSTEPIYIRTRKRNGTFATLQVVANWLDPRQDGDHVSRLYGYRGGLTIEFLVIAEVA